MSIFKQIKDMEKLNRKREKNLINKLQLPPI